MMIDDLFVDTWAILAATALMCSVAAVMNFATLHMTVRFLPQEYHDTKTGLVPGHDTPTPKGMDHNPLTIDTDMADISANHNHTPNPTTTGAAVVIDDTHCAPHPATAVAYATLWLTDALITTHARTHPTGIVTPHLEHATSLNDVTHDTTPQTIASLTLATLTAVHKDHSQATPKAFDPP